MAAGVAWTNALAVAIVAVVLISGIYSENPFVADKYEHPDQSDIMRACSNGDALAIRAYAKSGRDVTFYGERGLNPLFAAYETDNYELFSDILNLGFNINAPFKGSGRFYVPLALLRYGSTNRLRCADRKYLELLVLSGLDYNSRVGGEYYFIHAVYSGCLDYVRLMVDSGVDPGVKDASGRSALRLSVDNMNFDISLYLLDHSSADDIHEVLQIARQIKGMAASNHGDAWVHEYQKFISEINIRYPCN